MRTWVYCLAVFLIGCASVDVDFGDLDKGDLQEQVRAVLGEPSQVSEWTVVVPMWGPGESLTSELPQGTPVETWSYTVGDEVYYLHFDSTKKGKPLLGKEVYPEGVVFESEVPEGTPGG